MTTRSPTPPDTAREALARLVGPSLGDSDSKAHWQSAFELADVIIAAGWTPTTTGAGGEDGGALRRYRAATHWIGADAWDGCSDCMEVLRWAAESDPGRAMSQDEVAETLRPRFVPKPGAAQAGGETKPISSGELIERAQSSAGAIAPFGSGRFA